MQFFAFLLLVLSVAARTVELYTTGLACCQFLFGRQLSCSTKALTVKRFMPTIWVNVFLLILGVITLHDKYNG